VDLWNLPIEVTRCDALTEKRSTMHLDFDAASAVIPD
jgi:hypothetical protein